MRRALLALVLLAGCRSPEGIEPSPWMQGWLQAVANEKLPDLTGTALPPDHPALCCLALPLVFPPIALPPPGPRGYLPAPIIVVPYR